MKPLTVEELQQIEVGDWVWIIINPYGDSNYYCKSKENKCSFTVFGKLHNSFQYLEYGTKWIAYKNKEQYEQSCKS